MNTTSSAEISGFKRAADALTSARLMIAAAIALVAAFAGRRPAGTMEVVLLLVLIGWTTDLFDGRLARKDASGIKTRIGESDLAVDVAMDIAALAFFASAGYIPWLAAAAYFVLAATAILIWTNIALISMLELPVLALHPVLAFIFVPRMGWLFAGWMLMAMFVNWKRMWEWIHLYLAGIGNLWVRLTRRPPRP
ncbi:MAG: CDP-alcohol phosphatidyltransferase family protein [Candidatus Geothermincolia bacterium]